MQARDIHADSEDIQEAVALSLCDDVVVGQGNKLSYSLYYNNVKKLFPALKIQNAIHEHNEKKSNSGDY